MNIGPELIERIVRDVMRQMQPAVASMNAVVSESAQTAPLKIDSRVISEVVLKDAEAAGRRVELTPGAIITPSGRDFIRQYGVQVASRTGTDQTASQVGAASGGRYVISIGSHRSVDAAAAAAGWSGIAATTEHEAAATALQKSRQGLVACCGGEPSVVACLLNRHAEIRAAVVSRTTNLTTIRSLMNPQVVCIDPTEWTVGELMRLLRGLSLKQGSPKHWQELSAGGIR